MTSEVDVDAAVAPLEDLNQDLTGNPIFSDGAGDSDDGDSDVDEDDGLSDK